MLLAAAIAKDPAEARLAGPQTLIGADSPTAAPASVATRTMAASRRAVCDDAAGDGGDHEDAEEDEGCWVSYGWRNGLRRLPPPIPTLGPLARARTADGRLVISREEAAHRVCGWKVEDRLVLELVERDAATAPPQQQQQERWRRRWSHPATAQEASSAPAAEAHEEAAGLLPPSVSLEAAGSASPPPLEAQGCFEGAIRAAPLRRMSLSSPRMVR